MDADADAVGASTEDAGDAVAEDAGDAAAEDAGDACPLVLELLPQALKTTIKAARAVVNKKSCFFIKINSPLKMLSKLS